MGNYAYPHPWKENKSDTEYKEAWSAPRVAKEEKETKKQIQQVIIKKDRGMKW